MGKTRIKFKIKIGNQHFNTQNNIYVRLYGVKKCQPILIQKTTVNCSHFKLCVPDCFDYFYIVTNIKTCECTVDLMAVFSRCSKKVIVSEQSTVASVFCFTQFMYICKHKVLLAGKCKRIRIAYGMKNNFVHDNGLLSDVIQTNPNGMETNSYPLFNFLSNIINCCLYDKTLCEEFLLLAGGESVIQSLWNLSRNPFRKVEEIYLLFEGKTQVFTPSLPDIVLPSWKKKVVNQWTLTIKVNDSGSKNFIIGGPGYCVFDKEDRVWLTNNTRQGTPNSSTFSTILESDGKPASFSPLFGGGLLGGGFGVAVNRKGSEIAFGNFGWGTTDYNPQEGSVSVFKNDGTALSPSNGFVNGFKRAQGLWYDKCGNLWISGWGSQDPLGGLGSPTFEFESANSSVTVYIEGNPNNFDTYEFDSQFHGTFDVVVDDQGNVYASNAGNKSEGVKSSVYHFRLIDGKIHKINSWESDHVGTGGFEVLRQVTVAPNGFVYVAAVASSRVIKLDKQLNYVGEFTTNMDGPWGVTFSRDGTMFVANFRRETSVVHPSTFDMLGDFGVTVVLNDDDSTAKLMILPTGGKEVMLNNGFPLYGSSSKPCYEPLMRLTGTNIDRAGNLWAMNNWKPAIIGDFEGNPGGDGTIIFVGAAYPSK